MILWSILLRAARWPDKPATELKRMKRAVIPEAFFTVVHFPIISIGDRKIPPPTPMSPEISPMIDPVISPNVTVICLVADSGLEASGLLKYSFARRRKEATMRNNPTSNLKNFGVIGKYPPKNAIGNDVTINTMNILRSK